MYIIFCIGIHPTKEQLMDGEQVKVSTCEMFPWNDCENERTIYVMFCEGPFHYFLQPTSVNAGYCFGKLLVHELNKNFPL